MLLVARLCDGLASSYSSDDVLCKLQQIARIELTSAVIEALEQAEAFRPCVEGIKALRDHSSASVQQCAKNVLKNWKNAYKRHQEEGKKSTLHHRSFDRDGFATVPIDIQAAELQRFTRQFLQGIDSWIGAQLPAIENKGAWQPVAEATPSGRLGRQWRFRT